MLIFPGIFCLLIIGRSLAADEASLKNGFNSKVDLADIYYGKILCFIVSDNDRSKNFEKTWTEITKNCERKIIQTDRIYAWGEGSILIYGADIDIDSTPKLVFYNYGMPKIYDGKMDVGSIMTWVDKMNMISPYETLDDNAMLEKLGKGRVLAFFVSNLFISFVPKWHLFRDALERINISTVFINANVYTKIILKFGVEKIPSAVLFSDGKPTYYKGELDPFSIVAWIYDILDIKHSPTTKTTPTTLPARPPDTQKEDDGLDCAGQIIERLGYAVVCFFPNGNIASHNFGAIWKRIRNECKRNRLKSFTLDIKGCKELAKRANVKTTPTIAKYKHGKSSLYKGPLKRNEIWEWILGTKTSLRKGRSIEDTIENAIVLVYFSSDSAECEQFDDTWVIIQDEIPNIQHINLDIEDYDKLAKRADVKTTPKLVIFNHGDPTVYNGYMAKEEVVKWADKVYNEDNTPMYLKVGANGALRLSKTPLNLISVELSVLGLAFKTANIRELKLSLLGIGLMRLLDHVRVERWAVYVRYWNVMKSGFVH